MSVWNWFKDELSKASAATHRSGTPTTLEITLGVGFDAVVGGVERHVYGDLLDMTVDTDRMLEIVSSNVSSGLAGLLFGGTGGRVNWTYGRQIHATYVGPKVAISRATERKVTGLKYAWASKADDQVNPVNPGEFTTDDDLGNVPDVMKQASQRQVDRITGRTVAILSIIMVLATLALDLLLYLKVYAPDSDKNFHHLGPSGVIQHLKSASMTITTLVMGLIVKVEETAQKARDAITNFQAADQLSEDDKMALESVDRMQRFSFDARVRIKRAWAKLSNGQKDMIVCLTFTAALIGGLAALAIELRKK